MPLNSVVAIVLRLFSVSWLVQGVSGLILMAAALAPLPSPYSNPWNYVGHVFFVAVAVATWLLAPAIARFVTPRPDSTVNVGGLTRYDLYSFAFVFLGLYFVLSSVGNAINWLHAYTFLAMNAPQAPRNSFYGLTQALITCVAGGICIVFASPLAKKLTDAQRKYEVAQDQL
jgi:hypothetical protein